MEMNKTQQQKTSHSTPSKKSLDGSQVDTPEQPVSKKRRLSVRRKSLVETLQSVTESSKDILQSAEPTPCIITNENKSPLPENKEFNYSISKTQESSKYSSPYYDNYTLYRYTTLKNEAISWKKLLREYKHKAEESRLKSMPCLPQRDSSHQSTSDNKKISSINYQHMSQKVDTLEKRLCGAINSVSECMNVIHRIRIRQDNKLQSILEKKISESLTQYRSTDPKEIMKNIFKFNNLLCPAEVYKTV